MGWNAAWSSSPDKPVWALPGRSLSSQWTPQSEPIECVHHTRLQGDAGPNMIWFACMVVQRLSQQEPCSKYRASTFFSEIRERPLKLYSIYIHSLCPLRHSMAQKVVEESGLTFEYTPCLSILSHSLFSGTFPQTWYWALSQRLIDMLLQHCQGHICHLDSSRAAWHSPLLVTAGSEFLQNWKSLEVTSQVY